MITTKQSKDPNTVEKDKEKTRQRRQDREDKTKITRLNLERVKAKDTKIIIKRTMLREYMENSS